MARPPAICRPPGTTLMLEALLPNQAAESGRLWVVRSPSAKVSLRRTWAVSSEVPREREPRATRLGRSFIIMGQSGENRPLAWFTLIVIKRGVQREASNFATRAAAAEWELPV